MDAAPATEDDRQARVAAWQADLRAAMDQARAGAQLAAWQAATKASTIGASHVPPDRSTVRGRARIEMQRGVGRRKRKLSRRLNLRRAMARRRADRRERRQSREGYFDRGHLKKTPTMQARALAHRVSTLVQDPAAALSALGPAHRTNQDRMCTVCTTITDLDRCPLCGPKAPLVDHIACDGCGANDEVDRLRLGAQHTGRKCHGKWKPCQGDCKRCRGGA